MDATKEKKMRFLKDEIVLNAVVLREKEKSCLIGGCRRTSDIDDICGRWNHEGLDFNEFKEALRLVNEATEKVIKVRAKINRESHWLFKGGPVFANVQFCFCKSALEPKEDEAGKYFEYKYGFPYSDISQSHILYRAYGFEPKDKGRTIACMVDFFNKQKKDGKEPGYILLQKVSDPDDKIVRSDVHLTIPVDEEDFLKVCNSNTSLPYVYVFGMYYLNEIDKLDQTQYYDKKEVIGFCWESK